MSPAFIREINVTRASLNPFSSGHSLPPRGLAAGAIDGIRNGRFERIVPATTSAKPDDAMLRKLAEFMVTSFDENGPSNPDTGTPIGEAEPSDENATIPAAFTYFGQFVDHDMTLDTTDFGQSQKDMSATVDFRTPALDLDCIYGVALQINPPCIAMQITGLDIYFVSAIR